MTQTALVTGGSGFLAGHTIRRLLDDGWAEATTGCDYVLHMASPFPPERPADEND